ncbi:MAG TPA: sigma-70 family RNA polymerase sigma factor [Actinomycetota bacterium]|nr:sigma-70 family RNA polymerase sigma factor [Actinomycetota bacterium]
MRPAAGAADESLVDLFLGGDEGAFEELMRRHENRIFSLALRMMGDRAAALDVTQDTFITAWSRASSFRKDSAFGTWLYRIGINTAKDHLRKSRRVTLESTDVLERKPASGDVAASVGTRLDVARALQELPEEYREAVCMHDLGGIPYEEIALLTDTPIGTVKSRISRGRRRLAEILELQPASPTSKDG